MPHFVTFDRLQVTGVNRANPNDSPGPFDETGTTDEITGQNTKVIVHPSFIPDTEDLTNIGSTSGPGGTTYLTGYSTAEKPSKFADDTKFEEAPLRNDDVGYTEVEWTYFADSLGGNAGPGDTSYLTSYSEAVGLDSSSTFDVLNNVAGSASPGGDDI